MRNSKREWIRFFINVAVIALLVYGAINLFRRCGKEDKEWELQTTPLKVENARKIAELCTVSYTDEVVMDSVEYYDGLLEQIPGNADKLKDPESWKYALRGSAIKRRLTMIVGGEVRYGFNLSGDQFSITYKKDTAIVQVGNPQILDVIAVPSKTTIFQEHGVWEDGARIRLQNKAINILKTRSRELDLENRSKKQLESLLNKLITDNFTLKVIYK